MVMSRSLPFWSRSGTFSVGLEVGVQTPVGCGGYSDNATKCRCRLIEGKRFPARIADGAAALFDEQDSGREIPFVFRLDRQGGLDTACSDQGQCIGDGVHGATPSGLGKG